MGLVLAAVFGLIAGALARLIYPGAQEMSWFKTMLLGVGGGFVAGFLGRLLGWYPAGQGAGIIASALGAMLIIFVVSKMRESKAT